MNPFGNRDRSLLYGVLLCSIFSALGAPPKGSTDTADDLFKRGEALASSGRVAEAEVQLSSAATLAPHDPGILTLLAKVKARLGESKEAVELFRRVAGERPRSATAHLNLAIALADAGDPTSALAEVDKSILLDPQSLTAHLNRARMLADANRVSAARAEFLRTERIHPGDPETEFFHAVLEKDNHRPQAASALLARVVARQPDNGQAYFLLDQTLQALNREEEAVAAFRRAMVINPAAEEPVYALYQAQREKDPAEASRMLEKFNQLRAEKQRTDQARNLGNRGWEAMQRQSWDDAITALRQAIDVCGKCVLQAGLHQRLGLAECHAGNLDAGESELRLALSLDPADRTAVEALQWVANQRAKSGAALIQPQQKESQ